MEKIPMKMPGADVVLYPAFFSEGQSDVLLESLARQIAWNQERIHRFGRTFDIPRLTAWYGEEGLTYSYSGITQRAIAWTAELLEIKARIESVTNTPFTNTQFTNTQFTNTQFNSVLLNRYRDGRDSVSWHSDDEPDLGINPVIASVSFGQTRRFQFKHKQDSGLRKSLELAHGSLLLMCGATQHGWLHQIPKSKRPMGERINLTYRVICQTNLSSSKNGR